jgi:hypothetical protein
MMKMSPSSTAIARANAIAISAMIATALLMTVTIASALDESPAAAPSAQVTLIPAAPPAPNAPTMAPTAAATPAPFSAPSAAATLKPRHHVTHHAASSAPPEVEPVPPNTRLKVKQDGWIYASPAKSGKHLERATAGKFVNVSGSTRYYLQAQLKNGQTGYIPIDDVELVKPVDKVFILTHDASVLEAPNRWAKKINAVHRNRKVHIIGLALNYMQIRMKSGLVGFIPASALQ